jgi:hypothetical protein
MAQIVSEGLRIAEALFRQNSNPVLPQKPSWWSLPWQRLEHEPLPTDSLHAPRALSPRDFREQVDTSVMAVDSYHSETKTDPNTGKEISGGEGNHLVHGVVGIVWSDGIATLSRAANYNGTKEELVLAHVALLMGLVPEGEKLELHTESEWLATEMEKMREHEDADFGGDMSWEQLPVQVETRRDTELPGDYGGI